MKRSKYSEEQVVKILRLTKGRDFRQGHPYVTFEQVELDAVKHELHAAGTSTKLASANAAPPTAGRP